MTWDKISNILQCTKFLHRIGQSQSNQAMDKIFYDRKKTVKFVLMMKQMYYHLSSKALIQIKETAYPCNIHNLS